MARNWFEELVGTTNESSASAVPIDLWVRIAGGLIIFLFGLSLFLATNQAPAGNPLL